MQLLSVNKMIRVIHQGLGPIGCSIARLVASRKDMRIVGAVDIAESKVGKDLGKVIGLGKKLGIKVKNDPTELYKKGADVVINSTVSSLRIVSQQILEAVAHGINVVSTCEELSYPYFKNSRIAKEIDNKARLANVSVLGTGVNPGFVMDKLVLVMSAAMEKIDKIEVKRVVNASKRRFPLQLKIGAGKTVKEFRKMVLEGKIRHVGLPESVAMISSELGFDVDSIKETINPVVAKKEIRTKFLRVKKGNVAGVHQIAVGTKGKKELIKLELMMYVGAEENYDQIKLKGIPNVNLKIEEGLHGDIVTAAMVVNVIKKVINARPGLLTMSEIPVSYSKEKEEF